MFTLNFRSRGLMLALAWLAYNTSSGWGQTGQAVSASISVDASMKASSLQPELPQVDESQRPLRFNVSTYTGKLTGAEQLFAASKVEPVFLNSAVIVQKTERVQIDPHDLNVTVPWDDRVYTWAAPQFYHKPLYFQQVNLERYGIGPCSPLQPAHSVMHFYGSTILWPAKMLWNAPAKSIYSLGHQRPGDCVDYQNLSPE